MIEATTQQKVGIVHSDGALEFKSNNLLEFYHQQGVQYKPTHPHSPPSNRPVEIVNHWLMERIQSLLFNSGLPKNLWGEAAKAAIMMINLSPTATEIFSCLGSSVKPTSPFDYYYYYSSFEVYAV